MTGWAGPTDPGAPLPATATTTFDKRQQAFVERLTEEGTWGLHSGCVVVLPSTSFATSELRKIVGVQYYEERLLYLSLLLDRPELSMVYVTSLPVDPDIVDYYLSFLPDPDHARRRLRLLSVGDPEPCALSAKLLANPQVLDEVRAAAGGGDAYVLPFNVTDLEAAVCDRLALPLFGPSPGLVELGSKTGSRRVARQAGVAVPDGDEGLYSMDEVEDAISALRARRPDVDAVVVKLNNGFSGQGNAIVAVDRLASTGLAAATAFCADEESWPSYAGKVANEGAIVEELVRHSGLESPSAQARIAPGGAYEVVSTHDQILGGTDNQVYLGCRFPARDEYRHAIRRAVERVADVLAREGVIGHFGVDFLVVPGAEGPQVTLSEINLRMGGTTHPFGMAAAVTGGAYDGATGELVAGGRSKSYVATDNLKSAALVGRRPAEAIDALTRAGLAFDRTSCAGATLHLLGALRDYGKVGLTCIGDSPAEANGLYSEAVAVLSG